MPPRRVRLTAGADALRCLRLPNQRLALVRRLLPRRRLPSPSPGRASSVIGVVHALMDHAGGTVVTRDEVLGTLLVPPLPRRSAALRPIPTNAPGPAVRSGVTPATLSELIGWWAQRDQSGLAELRQQDDGSVRGAARAHAELARRTLTVKLSPRKPRRPACCQVGSSRRRRTDRVSGRSEGRTALICVVANSVRGPNERTRRNSPAFYALRASH